MPPVSKTITLAVIAVLIAPASSFAQATGAAPATSSPAGTPNAGSAGAGTTGVSGIPQGPGSVGGNNNSINDPSGVGNASKVPPLPSPSKSTTGR